MSMLKKSMFVGKSNGISVWFPHVPVLHVPPCKLQVARPSCKLQVSWSSWQVANCKLPYQVGKLQVARSSFLQVNLLASCQLKLTSCSIHASDTRVHTAVSGYLGFIFWCHFCCFKTVDLAGILGKQQWSQICAFFGIFYRKLDCFLTVLVVLTIEI